MKELIFLRHAKSSWKTAQSDKDRPLTLNGIKRIINIAQNNEQEFLSCDIVFSSFANRATHTAVLMMETINMPFHKLTIDKTLYTFQSEDVLDFISCLDDKYNKVMIVGHNPALTIVTSELSGSMNVEDIKTSHWRKIQFDASSWSEITIGKLTIGTE